ncbi:MAG: smalltalk protein [Phocaeicola sp.]|nr:smalltalk protein [Phocaeicola sp.]
MNERTKKTTWTVILKVIITVVTALASALGLNACIG